MGTSQTASRSEIEHFGVDWDVWASGSQLPTPYVAVHLNRLQANLDRVAKIGRAHAVSLRPHVKTHKCIEIARMQRDLGAIGITASKPQEALVFIEAGVPSVTIAYPIVVPRSAQALLASAARMNCDLRFVVDSPEGVNAIATNVANGSKAAVFLEIDVGLERCGVRPGSEALIRMAEAIRRSNKLDFRGILSHAGHAYAAQGLEEIAAIAKSELLQLRQAVDQLASCNVWVEEVSVGSTPTVLAAESFAGATEIRPGNYVFLDDTACRLGIASMHHLALGIVATVVSVNQRYCILDAGSKVLSSDTGAHGTGGGDFGVCFELDPTATSARYGRRVARLSEEHGFIEHKGDPILIGKRVIVFPNHSCPAVNLADQLVILEKSREPVFWAVAARGKTT